MAHYSLKSIGQQLTALENKMLAETEKRQMLFSDIHPMQLAAAKNLVKYLSLRSEDIRDLQDALHTNGLSSLASSESHIHRQLQSILQRLNKQYDKNEMDACTFEFNQREMARKSRILFGEKADTLSPFIMVTFDASFADNYALIKNLLQNGMNVARINCAHDDEAVWSKMIQHLKRACRYTGLACKLYMDLAGPKIRTKLIGKGKEKGKVKVKEGEIIWLADSVKGFTESQVVISPNETGIVARLKKGERVYIDDGMIKGVIESVKRKVAAMRIIRISSGKQQIKSGKGINFPDSALVIPPLTDFDRDCLPFICEHADMVGYSFVRSASDVQGLHLDLKTFSGHPPYVIIKIETPEAVKNLPELLLRGMREKAFGVMIARGDLAVEIGFERTGEIQEEILWICEAAHAPVIWATQVLETLNKTGIATRSEITDAGHAAMAECVMINKGDHTIEVIETLSNILRRTGGHHIKKRFTFRPLSIAENFIRTSISIDEK
ncbi:pyruvate kinase [Ferruginibacter paludis]|uniref:pyruvate kinase n=1 Tax=Ferruginibacter paludis TaxID=1310417 RepID=UPI0025B37FCB|nr:pyruvate kinase [Ferruginibacter paludis]MDN3656713.1 pyruvate kinase [Ferruginibacter paludis]